MSRVSTKIDVRRLGEAVSFPGIDPRDWLQLATVTDQGFDPDEGIFVDVVYQHSGIPDTCYLGQAYAGAEFGEHCPVDIGDTVLVACPMGDPGYGPVIICRWNNSGDKPPADFKDPESSDDDPTPTRDRVLRMRPGQTYRIRTSGDGGGVDVVCEGNGNIVVNVNQGIVYLAGDPSSLQVPLQGVLNGEAIDPFTGATHAALGNASTKVAARKV